MQLRQIRHFLLLCEELSFTRAARRCHVSQPSLTKSIRALEMELGGRLFRRKPTIELSELGRAVRPYLRRIAWADENARETARIFTQARHQAAPESSPGLNGDAN
jgi:LysR family transcriptional regulator, benzoate and cis,cis-muconate-responsive activator of ben and cat genes